jgi:hypothetical protein
MEFSTPVVAETWPKPVASKSRLAARVPIQLGQLISGSVKTGDSAFTLRLDDPDVDLVKGEDGQVLVVVDASDASNWNVGAETTSKAGTDAVKSLREDYGVAGLPSSALGEDQRIVASISSPVVRNESGQLIGAKTEISGRSLQISPDDSSSGEGFTAEILASLMGFTSDGWISYGADDVYEDSQTVVESGASDSKGQGCSFDSSGTIGPDVVQSERQIAFDPARCLSVSEVGVRPADVGGMAPRNGNVIRRANYTNWQEDPVGINVNWLRDWVSWKWNGTCVTQKVNQGHNTEVYEPTGWAKTEHHAGNDKDCAAATKWSSVTFKGGQFFPACAGAKVTTFYDNVVQGLRDGHANFALSRNTGGPPCHNLLHWESSRGNNVIS